MAHAKIKNIVIIFVFCIIPNLFAQEWTEVYWENLEVYRDNWGIPHILANNPRTLAFGFGYVQAQDHWESMLLSYRLANGKLSEVLGEVEELSDRFSIQVGHRYYASLAYSNSDSLTKDLCEGFAEGVNTWILENKEKLPEWVDGVQPQDIFSLWHAFIISMAPLDIPSFQKRPPALKSGFAFALSAEKSKENIPLFAFSAHQFYHGPFRWYEAHLICGEYNVYGCTLYGLPILLQGHTSKHAWALTPNQSDFADIFTDSNRMDGMKNPKSLSNPNNPQNNQALLLLQYMSQSEGYYVKTSHGIEQRFVPVHISPRGPLLLGSGNEFFSWKIGGYEDIGMFVQLWEMGKASSLEKFREAVYLHQIPLFHILYADNSNNLFYLYCAKSGTREVPPGLPEKEITQIQNINWTAPVSSIYYPVGWRYLIPPNLLPSILNPSSGFLQTCGSPPALVTDDVKFPPNDSINKLILDTENVISRRVKSVLRIDKRSLREIQSLLLDDLSSLAIETVPRIISIAEANQQQLNSYHPDVIDAVQILRNWNYRVKTDSSAPVIFYLWNQFFSGQNTNIPSIEVEPYFSLINKKPEINEHCLEALAEAVRFLRNNRDTIDINWGDIHKIQRGPQEYPIAGSETAGTTFLLSEFPPNSERWGRVQYGIGFASVIRLGTVVESYSIVPFGNSESIESPHYQDQWDLFNQRQMKKNHFFLEDIHRFAEVGTGRKLIFIPKGAIGEIRCASSTRITVSLQSTLTSPETIPENYIPFSVFITPEYTPKEANVQFWVKLFIPNDICKPEDLPNLSLHSFNPHTGWDRIENQNINIEMGFIEGIFNNKQTIVVLGPEKCYLKNLDTQINPASTDINSSEPAGKGIFSPGLPGEIPPITRKKGLFVPTNKEFSSQETLPKAIDIPPIKDNSSQEATNDINDKKEIAEKDRIEKNDKKLKKDTKNKNTKTPVKKNFTIKRN